MEIIKSSGHNLLSVIDDILDFSKIESNKLELEIKPFSLRDSVEESIHQGNNRTIQPPLSLLLIITYSFSLLIVPSILEITSVLL